MKMKLSIAAVAVLTLTAQAMQDQYNAAPQRPVQNQQQDDDLQRALELSAQQYEREVASREALVGQQEKEELEKAQRLSNEKLNEEFVNAVKHRDAVAATDIQEFLDQGADIEACDSDGLTSLMFAAEYGFIDAVNHLIKAGANIEAVANTGETPLHIASGHGRVECMKALIDYGANIDAQDEEGNTSLARAVENNKRNAVELLINSGANALRHIARAIENNERNAVELLINSGANALLPDYKGVTPFEKAMIGRSTNFPLCILLANSGVLFKPHFLTVLVLTEEVSCNSIDLARTIMSNIWLMCPSEQDMKARYARLKTGLLCINRVSDSLIPKDVRRLILCSDSELAMDLVLVFYYRLCKGDVLNKFQLNLLKQRLPVYLMNDLKSHLEKVSKVARSEPKFTSIFDPSTLESSFGHAIRTNIINRLNALQQKALANNETKENK